VLKEVEFVVVGVTYFDRINQNMQQDIAF